MDVTQHHSRTSRHWPASLHSPQHSSQHSPQRSRGYTVPALLLALVAGLLTWAVTMDKVQSTAVQARVSEAEVTAMTVMAVLQDHCASPAARLAQQPYRHVDAPDSYIAALRIDGSCRTPELHIAMRHTDALPVEPEFVFAGQWAGDVLTWHCRETAGAAPAFVPAACR